MSCQSRVSPADFHTDGSPNTVKKILAAWPLGQVRKFFEDDLAVPLALEEESGKLFPHTGRAGTVLDALLGAAQAGGVTLRLHAKAAGVEAAGDRWLVRLESGEALAAGRVIVATGGLSVPSTGSDGAGLRMAQELGHTLITTYPALTPLTTNKDAHKELAGVSLTARVSTPHPSGKGQLSYRDGFLFTHRGYSGPAVLNISHVAARSTFVGGPRPVISVQWSTLDAGGWEEALREGSGFVIAVLRQHLPERLAILLLAELNLTGVKLGQLRREERQRLIDALTRYTLPWSGHEGYRVAEVTGGGVPLGEVNPATLESRVAPGLHLCGEVLDAFGPIGGYNFLWAWVTGRIAGVSASRP